MNLRDYLRNPDKWQAHGHPSLTSCKPEALFEASFCERYYRLHKDLSWRVIRLHGTLHTLEQLDQFPFDFIYAPSEMEFWRLVFENFVDGSVLLLHGLAIDTGTNVHSLKSFKN